MPRTKWVIGFGCFAIGIVVTVGGFLGAIVGFVYSLGSLYACRANCTESLERLFSEGIGAGAAIGILVGAIVGIIIGSLTLFIWFLVVSDGKNARLSDPE